MQQAPDTLPLKGLHLPDAPSWFPLTAAWWLSLAGIIVLIGLGTWLLRRHQRRILPRNTALKLVKMQTSPSAAMEVLRQVSFSYFSREQLASLHGDAWYQFLDNKLGDARFVPRIEQWQAALYQPTSEQDVSSFIADCEHWIRHALPPKSRTVQSCSASEQSPSDQSPNGKATAEQKTDKETLADKTLGVKSD
ncbi:DUF4381 domain-containing protein [Vibrio sp. WXL103]|uniref:DUF4381 domain-containing protein n=1 Tax=unclassified Vibrio TaxID=2614977 RepID=UPI003EC6819A